MVCPRPASGPHPAAPTWPLRLALLPGPRLPPRRPRWPRRRFLGHLLRGEQRQDCTRENPAPQEAQRSDASLPPARSQAWAAEVGGGLGGLGRRRGWPVSTARKAPADPEVAPGCPFGPSMPRLCPRPHLFTRDTALSRRLLAGGGLRPAFSAVPRAPGSAPGAPTPVAPPLSGSMNPTGGNAFGLCAAATSQEPPNCPDVPQALHLGSGATCQPLLSTLDTGS